MVLMFSFTLFNSIEVLYDYLVTLLWSENIAENIVHFLVLQVVENSLFQYKILVLCQS